MADVDIPVYWQPPKVLSEKIASLEGVASHSRYDGPLYVHQTRPSFDQVCYERARREALNQLQERARDLVESGESIDFLVVRESIESSWIIAEAPISLLRKGSIAMPEVTVTLNATAYQNTVAK
jgi:hypothetical protein